MDPDNPNRFKCSHPECFWRVDTIMTLTLETLAKKLHMSELELCKKACDQKFDYCDLPGPCYTKHYFIQTFLKKQEENDTLWDVQIDVHHTNPKEGMPKFQSVHQFVCFRNNFVFSYGSMDPPHCFSL